MIEAFSRARAFAPAATPVVLYGETGCGKTYFANYIHELSQRAGGFHAFNLGGEPAQLAPDALFGHVKGAFTDAQRVRAGWIAEAGGGTMLLDDMQTVDLGVQKQLLQVLDRGTYRAVGGDRVLTVACRIILAMTEDPDVMMKKGVLLKDLRYRFGACTIRIPSLSERRPEIPFLAQWALQRCAGETKLDGPTRISEAALAILAEAEYEGNVRELRAVLGYAFLMARAAEAKEIRPEHLPRGLRPGLRYQRRGGREANRIVVERALAVTGGNVKAAAELLGISRNALNAARRVEGRV